jgi:hypothetical protein
MSLGFIILRHVNSKLSDLYWKECYTCIRKFYTNPILIVDDSSNREFLNENIFLKDCTVIYDTEYKGRAELLPYYYFHKLKPFDTAVLLHDSIFIQTPVVFDLAEKEQIKFLWSFSHAWDDELFPTIDALLATSSRVNELHALYHRKQEWIGCFGCMSVVRWKYLDTLTTSLSLFSILMSTVLRREHRHGLERALALFIQLDEKHVNTFFGPIHSYIPWGTTFQDYLCGDYSSYPLVKVWTGR